MLRRLLAILLCLGLALPAMAAPTVERAPCPMEAQMQAALSAGETEASDLPDCCQDLVTYAATGQACKAQLDCSLSAVILPAESRAAGASSAARLPGAKRHGLGAAPVAGPWRPPARG